MNDLKHCLADFEVEHFNFCQENLDMFAANEDLIITVPLGWNLTSLLIR